MFNKLFKKIVSINDKYISPYSHHFFGVLGEEKKVKCLSCENEILLNAFPGGIFRVDMDGKINFLNLTAIKILGYREEELIGKEFYNLVHCSGLTKNLKPKEQQCSIYKSLIDGNVQSASDEVFYGKDGKDFPVKYVSSPIFDEKGKILGAVVVFSDITAEKKKEKLEKKRKAELENTKRALLNMVSDVNDIKNKDEAILASIGDGLIAVDREGMITTINERATDLLRIKKEDTIGLLCGDLFQVEDEKENILPLKKNPIQTALSGGRVVVTAKDSFFWYARLDGSKFPVAMTVTPIILNGKVDGAINIFRDITKEKEVDRMKSEFLSIASHQLRTPLSSIKWTLEILLESESLIDKDRTYLKDLYLSNERLIDLVNNLLNVVRKEETSLIANKKIVDFVKIIDSVLESIKPSADKKKQKINFVLKTEVKEINTDPNLLTDVLSNLLSNAVDYGFENTNIDVVVAQKEEKYVVSVHSFGIIIARSDYEKIFTKFYRSQDAIKAKAAGSGLGLYIAKMSTEANGGKIWFDSEIDKGTTFYFTIPVK